jgi:predicted porin
VFDKHPNLKMPSFQATITVRDIPSKPSSNIKWKDEKFKSLSGKLSFALGEEVYLNYSAEKLNSQDSDSIQIEVSYDKSSRE